MGSLNQGKRMYIPCVSPEILVWRDRPLALRFAPFRASTAKNTIRAGNGTNIRTARGFMDAWLVRIGIRQRIMVHGEVNQNMTKYFYGDIE